MKDKIRKYLLPNLPYLFFVYLFDKLCQAVRLAPGLDASEKLLHIGQGFQTAFASSAPSFHALDICVGIDETVTVRLWNTENMSENILQSRLDKKQKICTFTHLSSRNRYAITVDNMPDISISVSSRLTFWEAFSQALQNE